jgi:hypothetical protein
MRHYVTAVCYSKSASFVLNTLSSVYCRMSDYDENLYRHIPTKKKPPSTKQKITKFVIHRVIILTPRVIKVYGYKSVKNMDFSNLGIFRVSISMSLWDKMRYNEKHCEKLRICASQSFRMLSWLFRFFYMHLWS